MNSIISKKDLMNLIFAFLGFSALLLQAVINPVNTYASALMLLIVGFSLYFLNVFLGSDKNWLDVKAVFSGVWLVTIGLACLQITYYQEKWQTMTWVWTSFSYLAFQIGAIFGINKGQKWAGKIDLFFNKFRIGKIRFELNNNRLFIICLVGSAIGLVFFIINAVIKGYVPAFSSDPHAYTDFYTRYQTFAVAGTGMSGVCYYAIRTQKLSKIKKAILYVCILYNTFLYPILVASRGSFLASAIALMVAAFYLHNKKFIALVLSLIIMFSVYWGCSYLRNYTDEQLKVFFEPKDFTGEKNDSQDGEDGENKISLPPKVIWLYSYLTVSHDNFNEAVQNVKEYTYGTRQFVPLNTVFRFDFVKEMNENSKRYLVRPHLNTNNLIGDFYYDFGGIGVIICTLLWAFVFGLNQGLYEKTKSWIYLGLLGNTLVPVVLCFFATWTSLFSQWMLWGVILLCALAAGVTIKQKEN